MLTRTNYQDWALLMTVNLQAQGLWHAVEPEPDDVIEDREDRLALAAILRAVPPEMLGSLGRKLTARSAWEAVKTVRVGVQRVRDSAAAQLKKDFADITFKDGESVDDFALRIVGLANNIRVLDHDVTDADVVKKLLQVVPDHLSQIAVAIETFLDVDNIAIKEVAGRLRQIEERDLKKKKKAAVAAASVSAPRVDNQGRLLLSEEEWNAKIKIRGADDSSSSSGGQKRGKTRRGRNANSGAAVYRDPNKPPATPCYKCKKTGHWAAYCPFKPKKG